MCGAHGLCVRGRERPVFVTHAAVEQLVDIPNSITVLPELLPAALLLVSRKAVGVFNFVNPGVMSHNQVLRLYKEVWRPCSARTRCVWGVGGWVCVCPAARARGVWLCVCVCLCLQQRACARERERVSARASGSLV